MSHYSVMVLTDDATCVDMLLERYDENMEVEQYIRYTKKELIENRRNYLLKYKDSTYKDYLADPQAYIDKFGKNETHIEYISKKFPKLLESIDDDDAIYQEAVSDYDPEDITEDGDVLSTYNPDSKWDWYVEGGRWSGHLKLKDGGCTDSAYAEEIDFSPSKEDVEYYTRFWEIVVDGDEPKTDEEREIFNIYRKEYYLERYDSKEDYVAKQCAFSTYAVVTPDGEWHEPGRMGWFGVSMAEPEEEKEFAKNYQSFIDEAVRENYLVTIVDCHI